MKGVKKNQKKLISGPKMPHFPHFEHNKKLFSKTWLRHIFAFVTAYFHEKKKENTRKDF